ncbi:MAG TPA: SRPBCC family protein [Mycobacteriales bacterium]|nr:SRPBCC family protein [Mycobacteriales bacterium]
MTKGLRPATAAAAATALAGAAVVGYGLVVRGDLVVDTGLGRRLHPLGPLAVDIAAPRDVVFDVIAEPYLGRLTRAMAEKVEVVERGTDMVLAAHRTKVGWGLVSTTVETVRFERPDKVAFRLLRGPVPYVVEAFYLADVGDGATRLSYTGELGADFGPLGEWWGRKVARTWVGTVAASFDSVRDEAERRAAADA